MNIEIRFEIAPTKVCWWCNIGNVHSNEVSIQSIKNTVAAFKILDLIASTPYDSFTCSWPSPFHVHFHTQSLIKHFLIFLFTDWRRRWRCFSRSTKYGSNFDAKTSWKWRPSHGELKTCESWRVEEVCVNFAFFCATWPFCLINFILFINFTVLSHVHEKKQRLSVWKSIFGAIELRIDLRTVEFPKKNP